MLSSKCITIGLSCNPFYELVYILIITSRDSTKYRTPYAHWGGFTNGYEGSLRDHLMRTPDALFGVRRQSVGLSTTNSGLSSMPHSSATGASPSTNAALRSQSPVTLHVSTIPSAAVHPTAAPSAPLSGTQSAPPLVAQPLMAKESSNWRSSSVSDSIHWDINANTAAALHPAIRAHYAAMLQSQSVKVESQSDTGSNPQPLTMIPPSPVNPIAPPITPVSVLPAASPFNQSVSRQPIHTKSTTPIPPPSVPISFNASQNTAMPASSVKATPAVPKQTYIPAPRPWEALRKSQVPTQPAMAQSPALIPTFTNTNSALMTPSPQALPVYSSANSSGHLPSSGLQSNHVVSGPFRHTFPPAVPNSNRFSLPAFGYPPYASLSQPPPNVHSREQYMYQHQQTQSDHLLRRPFQGSNPHPYRFPQ